MSRPQARATEPHDTSWKEEVLELAIDGADAASRDLRRLHSYEATYLAGSDVRRSGKLVILPNSFKFTATTDQSGRPSLTDTFDKKREPLVRSGSRLVISARQKQYCFELASSDLDKIEALVQERQQSLRRLRSFDESIADSCVHGNWPGIDHPFFERHASASTDRAAVFDLIGWQFLTRPLPWDSYDITVKRSAHKLLITANHHGDQYSYYESPVALSVSFESESVGFFDDSGYSESSSCVLEFVKDPSKEVKRQAIRASEAKDAGGSCYLRYPFAMKGIFRLVRKHSRD